MSNFDIGVVYGEEGNLLVKELLDEYNLAQKLAEYNSDVTIGIKPNLVVAKPADQGATTDPEIVAGIIEYLYENDISNIKIIEGSWVGCNTKRAFKACGYSKLAKEYDVELVDLKKDKVVEKKVGSETIKVCKQALDVDYLINMPVLKAHCQTKITCALKNLKGCIPDGEKRRFHSNGLHKPIAQLNEVLKADLIIVDGLYGDLTFEEGGNPVKMDRLIIGEDPVLIDTYAAHLLGYDFQEIDYISYAYNLGLGSTDLEKAVIKEFNTPEEILDPESNLSSIAGRLAKYVEQDSACSACYGNLIHALYRLQRRNELNIGKKEIHIGQAFAGKSGEGIGIGKCTRNFNKSVPGCPPPTNKIIEFLRENM